MSHPVDRWLCTIVAMRTFKGYALHMGSVYCPDHRPAVVLAGLHVTRASSPDGCYACGHRVRSLVL